MGMKGKLLVVHGGAPTAVMNASLWGVVEAATASGAVDGIYGARGGMAGLLAGDYIDLSALPAEVLDALPSTPASYIGTSRFPIEAEGYDRIVDRLVQGHFEYLLVNGGNGSMDACGKIAAAVARRAPGAGIKVAGIPKTIDNDLAGTDHAPGFGSAARYLAASVAELAQDLASLPIHVCVIECMGRNAGWLAASAALADPSAWAGREACAAAAKGAPVSLGERPLGPHLIYVPELPFDEERFLDEAKALYDKWGGVLVVASEGLRDAAGEPIVPPLFQSGRSVYYGDVSAHLAGLVIRRLGVKARSEKPGILGRCSVAHQSSVDKEEAIAAGRAAVEAVLAGRTGVMVGFRRISSSPYRCELFLSPLEEVMLLEKTLPIEYLNPGRNGIDASFCEWCKPLLGGPLPIFADRSPAEARGEAAKPRKDKTSWA